MADTSDPKSKGIDRNILRRMLRYVRPYRRTFALAWLLTIVLAVLSPVRPLLVQRGLDQEVAQGDIMGLRVIILLLVGILVLEGVIMYANTYLTNWLGQSIIRDIRDQVFRHILRLRLAFFDRTPIGTLQTRTINDVETLNNVFTSGLVQIFSQLLQLIAILVAMFYLSWSLTLAVLTTLPFLVIATIIFKNKVKVAFQQVRKSVSTLNAFLQEHLSGMTIIHMFNRERVEMDRYQEINKTLRDAHIRSVMYYSVFYPVIEIITAATMAVLVWYGANRVIKSDLQFGELVAFIMFVQMFFRPIRQLADQFNTLQMGVVSADRIFQVLDNEERIPDEGEVPLPVVDRQVKLDFDQVWFAYRDEEWVLKDVSFQVEPGQKVALVGSTGSGKTTIINLFNRFYDVQRGQVLVNGQDVRDYPLDDLRSLTGMVLQDVFLFSGSIHDNITLNNPDISREQVIEAAKQVGAHAFIMQLPGDYDYEVRERGATLSLGQRQLIAFARVMTYDPQVLVLDEATANIDTESEEIIQQAINTILSGRTSIIIAHRLSTIQRCDQILVLHKGSLIERGTHQELLAQQGAYFDLHQIQMGSRPEIG